MTSPPSLGSGVLPSSSPALLPSPSPSPHPGQQTEWDKKREEGKAASQANLWNKARDAYRAAWQIKQDWKVAANLGRAGAPAWQAPGRAAEHLTYAVREAPASLAQDAPAEWNALRDLLQTAQNKVGRLSITVEPAGAEVVVAGLPVGIAPLTGPVFVDSGTVAVDARAPGYVVGSVSVRAGARKEETVRLVLVLMPAAAPTPLAKPVESRVAGGMSSKRLAGIVIGGVGVAGLVSSAVTNALAMKEQGNILPGCKTAGQCSQDDLNAERRGKTLTIGTGVALGLGLAGAGAGAYFLVTSFTEKKSNASLSVTLEGTGMSVRGKF